jgi:glycosyltransferase involved in cell wall biosynthesis
MRVVIATVKVPFVFGGAEILADGLLQALLARGHEAEIVAVPFKHYPPERILDHMLACRLLDLSESFGVPIDRIIALKFPSYLIPHPSKVLWLLHQHRQAYELWAHPEFGELMQSPNGSQVREAIYLADSSSIREFKAVFTLSCTVSRRLKEGCGISSTPLYNPPPAADEYYWSEPEDYLFFPSRISRLKRQSLVLRAMAKTREQVRVRFAGASENPELERECESLQKRLGLGDRVQWIGRVSDEEKRRLYAGCLGVIFPPFDEDYGYVTLEAMLSGKAVLTCTDSGGPLEFVLNRQTGLVTQPTPEALAAAMDELWADRLRAKELGQAGRQRYSELNISWSNVVDRLLR